jgi:hypothetical protein
MAERPTMWAATTNRTVTSTAAGGPVIEWDRAGAAATGTPTITMATDTMATDTMEVTRTGITMAGVRLPADPTARRRQRDPCRRFLGIRAVIE